MSTEASLAGTAAMNEKQYIEERVDDQLNWYSRRARVNRRCFRWLRIIEIVFAASIPLFTSLLVREPQMTIVISAVGVLIVVISGVLGLYKFQENWIEYRMTAERLKHEKYMFLTRTSPYDKERAFGILVERIEAELAKEGISWGGYIRQPATTPASATVSSPE